MNLLPPTEKEDLRKGLKTRSLAVSSFLVAASFLASLVLLLPSYFLALGNFAKTGKESQLLYVKNDESAKNLLNLPGEISSKLQFLQSQSQEAPVSDSFYKVLGFLPEGIILDSVGFARNQLYNEKNGNLISFSGTASTREALVSFSSLLKESNLFSAVDVPVSSLTKDKNLPFSIKIFIEKKN